MHREGPPVKNEDTCTKNLNQGNANQHSEFPCLWIKTESWVEAGKQEALEVLQTVFISLTPPFEELVLRKCGKMLREGNVAALVPIIKENENRGRGDGSVRKVFSLQAWGPEFSSQKSC